MFTFTSICRTCGETFTYEREQPVGMHRRYCDDCRRERTVRRRTIKERLEVLMAEVRESLARTNATLDRIEARQHGGTR
ncbi:hypothetical protein A2cp1_1295 [Anaeromyxobacter dehalogenans 2CP-1]|uniref:Uncharacterized protein n=1 Tax=Anaeromyxobacter dehalogenans (strain ATCC BAA-258 / DSM 21875 / 2CP-1) TaxID=455488 RepID=B8JGG8_ANAD2|nr:hypothetical protein [Anaeromyxobacter dehalogenans]ACL64639.1 hypothetical protein A2cp1_1295 [Anaeromyxobacter dehalogenans 2CP-1]